MIELTAAAAISATLMVGSILVIRSSHAAWLAHEGDAAQAAAAEAVVRHVSRAVRQAGAVVSISGAAETAGWLQLADADGVVHYWEHTGTAEGFVDYNAPGARLARGIDRLVFTGYTAEGVAAATPSDVRLVEVLAQVTMPRGAGQTRLVTCRAWLRSW